MKVIPSEPVVVSEVTETAVTDVLLMMILPAFESAEIEVAARFRAVVLPIPDSATMVMDDVVIKPEPLMVPALR